MMTRIDNLREIDDKIKTLRMTAEKLQELADNIPAVTSNTKRILAGIKMLEINISDCLDLDIVS